ncbi:MAG: tRNA dihydrouridine synthase DusB [Thiotrichales bacterium]|nr:tRNA dihydrouridine synthase DusB [Thiotrichales bacterium]
MFKIGPYCFANRLVLAPMAGVTDAIYRQLCREQGAAYTIAEMVASKKSLWESKKSTTRHVNVKDPEPRAVQLIGTNAEELAEAAAWQVSQGAQIIDLNMGCPAKKVCAVAAGSALMAQPEQVRAIFRALVETVAVPVTVKIRTGTEPDRKNALEIAQLAEACGLQAISIHGRTRADKFQGQAEYETIRQVKEAVQIPVIANGDICSPEKAAFVLEYTGADAIMIGRASQGYPWIFREINHYLSGQPHLPAATPAEFYDTIARHLQGLYALYGPEHGVRIARKHLVWYLQHLAQQLDSLDCHNFRREFSFISDAETQLLAVERFFARHL